MAEEPPPGSQGHPDMLHVPPVDQVDHGVAVQTRSTPAISLTIINQTPLSNRQPEDSKPFPPFETLPIPATSPNMTAANRFLSCCSLDSAQRSNLNGICYLHLAATACLPVASAY